MLPACLHDRPAEVVRSVEKRVFLRGWSEWILFVSNHGDEDKEGLPLLLVWNLVGQKLPFSSVQPKWFVGHQENNSPAGGVTKASKRPNRKTRHSCLLPVRDLRGREARAALH